MYLNQSANIRIYPTTSLLGNLIYLVTLSTVTKLGGEGVVFFSAGIIKTLESLEHQIAYQLYAKA